MLCMDVHVWLVLWLSRSVLTTHLHARVHSHSLVLLCTCVLLHASMRVLQCSSVRGEQGGGEGGRERGRGQHVVMDSGRPRERVP